MKNLKGVICYSIATLFAVLTLAWNAMAFISTKVMGASISVSIYDAYGETNMTGDGNTARIMSIIALVLACLLTVTCVVALLNQLGIIKVKYMNYVNCTIAALFVLFAILAVIFCGMAVADANKLASEGMKASIGTGLIMVLISSIVSFASIMFATISAKKNA